MLMADRAWAVPAFHAMNRLIGGILSFVYRQGDAPEGHARSQVGHWMNGTKPFVLHYQSDHKTLELYILYIIYLFPMYALSLCIFTVLLIWAFKMINTFKLRTVVFLWCNYYRDMQDRTVVCLV